ncbi:unnamed protein product [Rotaria socialis]|nr:unnamed protein product [Rotaria socialis]
MSVIYSFKLYPSYFCLICHTKLQLNDATYHLSKRLDEIQNPASEDFKRVNRCLQSLPERFEAKTLYKVEQNYKKKSSAKHVLLTIGACISNPDAFDEEAAALQTAMQNAMNTEVETDPNITTQESNTSTNNFWDRFWSNVCDFFETIWSNIKTFTKKIGEIIYNACNFLWRCFFHDCPSRLRRLAEVLIRKIMNQFQHSHEQ